MWFHIDIQHSSTGTRHRKSSYIAARNACLRCTQAQEIGVAAFTQQAYCLAQYHGLRTTPANPTRYLPVGSNKSLSSGFCRSRSFAPDNRCQHKWFASQCQLVSQFKYRIRHGILLKKERLSLEARQSAHGHSAWLLNSELIRGQTFFFEDIPYLPGR